MVHRVSIFVMCLLKLMMYYLDFDCNMISNSLKSMYEVVEQSLRRTLNTRPCSKNKKLESPTGSLSSQLLCSSNLVGCLNNQSFN